jgi:hypothetical protein
MIDAVVIATVCPAVIIALDRTMSKLVEPAPTVNPVITLVPVES